MSVVHTHAHPSHPSPSRPPAGLPFRPGQFDSNHLLKSATVSNLSSLGGSEPTTSEMDVVRANRLSAGSLSSSRRSGRSGRSRGRLAKLAAKLSREAGRPYRVGVNARLGELDVS